jgi:hypothetical protein
LGDLRGFFARFSKAGSTFKLFVAWISVDFAWIFGRFSVDFAWIFFLRFSKAGYSFGPLFWSKIVGVRDKWILVR